MLAELQFVSAEAARAAIARSLGFADPPANRGDLQFELLRSVIWALTSGRQPAHVLRVLNRSTSIASVILQATDERQVRSDLHTRLDALADAGDLVELDGGLWLPAMSRLVHLGPGEGYLLVGGVRADCCLSVLLVASRVTDHFASSQVPGP